MSWYIALRIILKKITSMKNYFSSTTNYNAIINSFLNKYKINPIFVAVFTVNDCGGLLDLMGTLHQYRQYEISTHMIYVIQTIVNTLVQKLH